MTISVVQTLPASFATSGNFGSNVTAANTVFVVIGAYGTSAQTITSAAPTLGGSSPAGTVAYFNPGGTNGVEGKDNSGDSSYVAFWILPACPGGQSAVAISIGGGGTTTGFVAYEVSGLGTLPSLDQSSSGASTTGSTAVNSGTTGAITQAAELILGGANVYGGSGSGAAGFTSTNPNGGSGHIWAGYQIVSSSGGTYTWSQTGSGNLAWAAGIVTVYAPAPVWPPFLMSQRAGLY